MTPSSLANNYMAGLSPGQFSKRSPANALSLTQNQPTTSSSNGNAGLSSSALTYDSPSAAAALGLHLNNLPGSTFDGVTSGNVRGGGAAVADEDERRARVHAILETLRAKVGTVGREGVERLARRTGLDCLWEDGREGGTRTLSIAGSGVLIDVSFESRRHEHWALPH